MLCICLLLQPLPSLAMDGEAKTEQKITVSLTDGGSVKVTDQRERNQRSGKLMPGNQSLSRERKVKYSNAKRYHSRDMRSAPMQSLRADKKRVYRKKNYKDKILTGKN